MNQLADRCRPVQAVSLPTPVFAFGFSIRKQPFVRQFLGGVPVHFLRSACRVPAGASLLLWGSTPAPDWIPPDVRIVRIEDGFLRSVGLGADLVRPLSWVIDQRGIYYDARHPSDLEHLLATTDFTPKLLERAACLRQRIVQTGLTKYNVGSAGWQRPCSATRVILVPGQVESDASLRFGAPELRSNMALLRAVREACPDAYIVYKPHPDVVAGLRGRGIDEDVAERWCDEVVVNIAMNSLLDLVDEVHLLTSLAGFEALLRGKNVICYGQPFYAGWGLTTDIAPIARRTRRLTLDALVAGALLLYPSYVSRSSGALVTPEQALEELLAWRGTRIKKIETVWRSMVRFTLRFWGRE